jgi:tetratricopeptide (TPR) repeat protein
LQGQGDLAGAEPPLRAALALIRATDGERSKPHLTALNNLAALLHARGDHDAAEPLYRQVSDLQRELLGPAHLDRGTTLNNLGALLRDRGDHTAALPVYQEAVDIFRTFSGADAQLAGALQGLARVCFALQDYERAATLFRESLDIQTRQLPAANERRVSTLARLGRTLSKLMRFDEAERLLCDGFAAAEGTPAAPAVIEALIEMYESRAAADPAGRYAEQADNWRRRLPPASQPGR